MIVFEITEQSNYIYESLIYENKGSLFAPLLRAIGIGAKNTADDALRMASDDAARAAATAAANSATTVAKLSQAAKSTAVSGRAAARNSADAAYTATKAGALGTGTYFGAKIGQSVLELIDTLKEVAPDVIRQAKEFASQYGVPLMAGLAIVYGGKKMLDYILKNKELNIKDKEANAKLATAYQSAYQNENLEEFLGIPLTAKGRAVKRATKAAGASLDQEAKQMEIETLVWMNNSGITKLNPQDFKIYFNQKGLGDIAKPILELMPRFSNLSKRQVRQVIKQVLQQAYKRTSGFGPSTFAPGKK
jgi:hypothetical protein